MDNAFEGFYQESDLASAAPFIIDAHDAELAALYDEDDEKQIDLAEAPEDSSLSEQNDSTFLEVMGLGRSVTAWVGEAACAGMDPNTFFPDDEGFAYETKEICRLCKVRRECLCSVLDEDTMPGIWGGTITSERDILKKALASGLTTREHVAKLSFDGLNASVAVFRRRLRTASAAAALSIDIWEDQRECLDAIEAARHEGAERILFQLPPGRGKTTVAALAAKAYLERENPQARTAYICHNEQILRQGLRRFKQVFGDSYTYGMFVGAHKTWDNVDFLFTSFQTMQRWREFFSPDIFDLIIVDESHHAAAQTYEPTVDYFTPHLYLAMTATINRLDLLDIREIFGSEVYTETLHEAFAKGRLTPPHYKLMVGSQEEKFWNELKPTGITKQQLHTRVFIPERDRKMISVVQSELKDSDIKKPRILGFTDSIEHAERLASIMPKALAWHSRSVNTLNLFKAGKVNTLFTVNMANEGIDIPDINVILFFNRTDSEAKFIQQLGRGARLAEGKTHFLVLDFAGNCNRLFMVESLAQKLESMSEGRIKYAYDPTRTEVPKLVLDNVSSGYFVFTPSAVHIMERLKNFEKIYYELEGAVGIGAFARNQGVPISRVYKMLQRLGLDVPLIDVGGRLVKGLTPNIQKLLLAQPEFELLPPQPGEMSTSAFAAALGSTKYLMDKYLKELGVDINTLPRRQFNVAAPVLDEALQLRIKMHMGAEREHMPDDYLSLHQFEKKTGVNRATILKFAERLGLKLIKRRSAHMTTLVFSPEQQALLEQQPGFILPKAPPDALPMTVTARQLGVHVRRIKQAITELGIEATDYSFEGGARGKGLTLEQRTKIRIFITTPLR